MKAKIMLLAVVLLLAFGAAQAAAAAGVGWGGIDPGKTLNLTDEQKSKLLEINRQNYDQTRDLRIKAMDTRHELRQMQLQPNPDQAKIEAKTKELNDLRGKLQEIQQQTRQNCQQQLTPEQQNQMQQWQNKNGRHGQGKCFQF